MTDNSSKKWLIVQIKQNLYHVAIRNLERQGYEIFLPKIKTTIRKDKFFFIRMFWYFLDICLLD